MVERQLPKLNVAGSSPVSRSNKRRLLSIDRRRFFDTPAARLMNRILKTQERILAFVPQDEASSHAADTYPSKYHYIETDIPINDTVEIADK